MRDFAPYPGCVTQHHRGGEPVPGELGVVREDPGGPAGPVPDARLADKNNPPRTAAEYPRYKTRKNPVSLIMDILFTVREIAAGK